MNYTEQLLKDGQFSKTSSPKFVAVTFESTCNLKCLHCYWEHDVYQTIIPSWLSQINQLVAWNSHVIYAGRILSAKGANFIKKYCKKSGKKIGMIDNGFHILKYSDLFQLYDYINISIDGVEKDHDLQRQADGSCQVAWRAIHELKKRGFDPIISACVSPININKWDEFEKKIYDNNVPLSCTPVLGVQGNKTRMPLFSDKDLLKMFDKLLSGTNKLIKLLGSAHIKPLLPTLKQFNWTMKSTGYKTKVGGVVIICEPFAIDALVGRNLSWNGKFYVSGCAVESDFDQLAEDKNIIKLANKYASEEFPIIRELFK